jgi:hypothetical protein
VATAASVLRRDSRLAAANAGDSVERAVKRDDRPDAGAFGLRDEVGLGEIQSDDLIDLKWMIER